LRKNDVLFLSFFLRVNKEFINKATFLSFSGLTGEPRKKTGCPIKNFGDNV